MKADRSISELARLSGKGDRQALGELVERLRPGLFTVAYRILAHYQDAQDAVASSVLQVCLHIDDLHGPGRVHAWMNRIVRNEALKVLGSRAAGSPLLDGHPGGDEGGVHALRLDIREALRRLPRDQSHALALFYLAGISIEEIARRTGRPVGTIKRWLHHGRRRLARELEAYAPMKGTEAVIVSTDLSRETVGAMMKALRDAGFTSTTWLTSLPPIERTGEGDAVEFHLPEGFAATRFLVLDETVGGRSAFELVTLLNATEEFKSMASGILLSSPSESTVTAAWAAGFDLCLRKETLDMVEFRRFAGKIREQIAANEA
jgi:RNA polymerase sigma-70 factor (ECF subfamily)